MADLEPNLERLLQLVLQGDWDAFSQLVQNKYKELLAKVIHCARKAKGIDFVEKENGLYVSSMAIEKKPVIITIDKK